MREYDYPFTIRPLPEEDGGGYLAETPVTYLAALLMAKQLMKHCMT